MKQYHPHTHKKKETRRTQVGHKAGKEMQRAFKYRKKTAPVFPTRMLLSNVEISMIKCHQDDKQSPEGIQRQ